MQNHRVLRAAILLIAAALFAAGCAAQPETPSAAGPAPAATSQPPPATSMPVVEPTSEAPEPEAAGSSDGALRFEIIPGESTARYRVREQLANLPLPNDAIGETGQVSGVVALQPDGTLDAAASKFEVDVSSLTSDRSNRDNYVRRNVLQTDQYPLVVFVPRLVSGLPFPLPEAGSLSFQLSGDLTIRDVTREVTWEVSGELEGGRAVGQAQTSFTFADFDLTQPRVPVVLSIEDQIILEIDIVLQQAGGAQTPSTDASEAGVSSAIAGQGAQPLPEQPPACSPPAALTPPMTEGPYFKAGSPARALLREPGVPGIELTLSGYVLTAGCQPLPETRIEFWQTDGQGRYDNAGYTLRGHLFTDPEGRYRLESVVPGAYPGRTPHIHVKVLPPNRPVLTTQLFFPGEQQNQADRIFDPALLVSVIDTSDGVQASFDFIVSNP